MPLSSHTSEQMSQVLSTALLTPRGRGAIATIRVDGPDVRELVATHLFRESGRPITRWPTNRAVRAFWHHENGSREDVITFSPSDESMEIHCHGGAATTDSILQSLQRLGCEVRSWSDWVGQQGDSMTRREAWIQLPHAATETTALCLLDQFHGALDAELAKLAMEPPPADMLARLQKLAETYAWGKHLSRPWRVALGGPPNAGKSSLLNRLLGYDRALVFDLPGTTRDVLRSTSALAGWAIEFLDTPGWRGTAGDRERMGIELGQSAWKDADLRLLVLDSTESESTSIAQIEGPHLVLWNKTDLPNALAAPRLAGGTVCRLSARTGAGMEQLLVALERLLPDAPLRHEPALFTKRQYDHVAAALRSWTTGERVAARDAIEACRTCRGWFRESAC